MEDFAYSSTGEIGSQFLGPCVAVVVIFADRTVMLEHRSNLFLYSASKEEQRKKQLNVAEGHGDELKKKVIRAMNLLRGAVENILKFKRDDCIVR